MSMILKKYNNHVIFKNNVLPMLYKQEIINNLAIGILERLTDNDQPNIMLEIAKDGKTLIVILQTHPKQAILATREKINDTDLKEAVQLIVEENIELPGLVGERAIITKFSNELTRLKNLASYVGMEQRIYKLQHVIKKAIKKGELMPVSMKEKNLISNWVKAFFNEIGEELNSEEAIEKTIKLINSGYLYGWYVDGNIVSISASTRKTKNTRSVSLVFTPIEERKQGYASNQVAAFSQLLLDEGNKACVLYTDLSNPTSNKIYKEIGYKSVCDSLLIYFK